ncbi:MAG: cytochrome B6, partial [Chloroflexi bacterium]|nr:cytochrome B6 [Chloroflexota bacterium]
MSDFVFPKQKRRWWEAITQSALWRSFFRHGVPNNDLDRSLTVTSNVFLHLHPVRVRKHGLRINYTFGLGGLSFFLYLVLGITGAILMLAYVPSTSRAYDDIMRIQSQIPFGGLLRNLHRWGAELMVLTVLLHFCRVFYTGGYKKPREFNWVIG